MDVTRTGSDLRQAIGAIARRFGTDRRGATAVVFAVSAVGLLGLVGLGTEGGTWYLEKRHGQNVADAAATAGVLAIAANQDPTAAATDVATLNNYTTGTIGGTTTTVTVTPGTWSSGAFAAGGSPNAVRATVTRSPPRLFSALFLAANPTIQETAVAALGPNSNVCALALGGGLSFGGNSSINATNCSLASDATGSSSISFNGAGANKNPVVGGTLVASGGCTSGGSTSPCNGAGDLMYQPPTPDPFAALQSDPNAIPNSATKSACSGRTATSPATLANGVYCVGQSLSVSNGNTINLASGTYIFYDASIKVTGGTLNCSGCTIVFAGDSANKLGSLQINGGNVTLSAPATNLYDTNYDGILFYMDAQYAEHTNSCGSAPVSITGSSTVTLNGGMYFPNASACVSGTTSANSTCTEIVGWSLTFTGNSAVNVSGCSADGTQVAQTESVQLVQ